MPHRERHQSGRGAWLRASVLGANDGLLSTASLLLGVGAASNARSTVLTAGIAALVAGALSMAVGEYSSVSSQRDTELADLAQEREELRTSPAAELEELTAIYRERGLSDRLAHEVAVELTSSGDALTHHLRDELGLDPDDLARPAQASLVSAGSFAVGALPPVLIVVALFSWRVPATLVVTLTGLAALGAVGAHLGGAPKRPAAIRVLVGGAAALLVSILVGRVVGTAV